MTDCLESLDFASLRAAYAEGRFTPVETVETVYRRIAASGDDGIWIHLEPREAVLQRARALAALGPEERASLPLFGLPFNVKDCIDVAGVPTTAACPEFAYTAAASNPGVANLVAAGALFVGKTNLDQFATGLVGARSPYGVARNPFDARYLPGGSSSGAGASVATGLVSFGLGTDTGGSGRVPAAYTNTVGLKPTRGLISTRHMVPACRTLDCISVYALTASDAMAVLDVAVSPDPLFPYSRPGRTPAHKHVRFRPGDRFRFAVPAARDLEFFGDRVSAQMYDEAVVTLEAMGGTAREVDYAPFREVNAMMFAGPMVAERFAVVGAFLKGNPGAGHPMVRQIILGAEAITAAEAYAMLYRLQALRRQIAALWEEVEVFAVPTIGRPHKIVELEAEPLKANFDHGYYTNFVNPLDLAAIAVPNGFGADGMPRGTTLIAPAHTDRFLSRIGGDFQARRSPTLGADKAVLFA